MQFSVPFQNAEFAYTCIEIANYVPWSAGKADHPPLDTDGIQRYSPHSWSRFKQKLPTFITGGGEGNEFYGCSGKVDP